jgi:transposase
VAQVPLLKDGWIAPDDLWLLVEGMLPQRKWHPLGCHNPRVQDRRAFNSILYILSSGAQWTKLSKRDPLVCHYSSAYRRFCEWGKAGVFERLWKRALELYDEHVGIDWDVLAMDGSITKAPSGGEKTGPSPVDRRKCGTKRSLVVDGRGIPVALATGAANTNDHRLVSDTLESMPIMPPTGRLPLMCMDKGYDARSVRLWLCVYSMKDGIIRKNKKGGVEQPLPDERCRQRWVVERTHSWMNQFRSLKMRWCRRADCYLWMLHLAMALVTLQQLTGGRGELPRLNRRRDHHGQKNWKRAPRRRPRKGPLSEWRLPGAA